MKITQDLRVEAQALLDNEKAVLDGMAEKSKEFLDGGGALYVKS